MWTWISDIFRSILSLFDRVVEFVLGFVEPETEISEESPVKCAMEVIRGKNSSIKMLHHIKGYYYEEY